MTIEFLTTFAKPDVLAKSGIKLAGKGMSTVSLTITVVSLNESSVVLFIAN